MNKIPTIYERVLIYAYSVDNDIGRDFISTDKYSDVRESIIRYSSYYSHSVEMMIANIVLWEELIEIDYSDYKNKDGTDLLPIYDGFAYLKPGINISFYKALKKLCKEEMIYAFTNGYRAIKGLGGKKVPMLQLYNDADGNSKPSFIISISLTEKGFNTGKELCGNYQDITVRPWEMHRLIVKSKDIAEKAFGIKWLNEKYVYTFLRKRFLTIASTG